MKCNYKSFAQKSIQFYPCLCARLNSAARDSMKTITSKTALFLAIHYSLLFIKTISSFQNMLCANSSKTSMGYFYRKPLVYIHANHFNYFCDNLSNFHGFSNSWSPFFHFWVKHLGNFLLG